MTAPIPRDIPDLPAIPGMSPLMPSYVPASAVVAPARRRLVAVYRLLIALAAAGSVTVLLVAGDPARVLSHFAVQTGVLVTLVSAASARRAWSARRPLPASLTGATLLYALIGGGVYHLLLSHTTTPFTLTGGTTAATGWPAVAQQILLTALPVAVTIDWLFLTPPGALRVRQTATWLLYPLAFLAFSLFRGELYTPGTQGRYLYPFLDVDLHGYKSVLANALLLGLMFYAVAVLVAVLDRVRPNPLRHWAKTGFRLQPPVG